MTDSEERAVRVCIVRFRPRGESGGSPTFQKPNIRLATQYAKTTITAIARGPRAATIIIRNKRSDQSSGGGGRASRAGPVRPREVRDGRRPRGPSAGLRRCSLQDQRPLTD